MASPLISASKTIKASPDRVWSAVSDLAAMGRRSPQCRRMEVLGKGSGPHVGTITLNINRRGILFWPTWSVITEWTPGRLLEFRIPINGAHWRYELKDNGDGSTTLTESRIVKGDTSVVSRVLIATALGGNETFENELRRGIRRTLDSIADDATRS